MAEGAPLFDRREIGKLTLKLQGLCLSCPHKGDGTQCSFAFSCPIGASRKILADYIKNGEHLIRDYDFQLARTSPRGVDFDPEVMRSLLGTVHQMCNRCMFHGEKCFLNVVYDLLETAMHVNPKKAPKVRPGDDPLPERRV
jgi:hypothetical protein